MRNRLFLMPPIVLTIALMGISAVASADTLLVDRAQQKPAAALPLRGESMSQVEGRYGRAAGKARPTRWSEASVANHPSLGVSGVHRVLRKEQGDRRGGQQGRCQRDRAEAADSVMRR